MGKQILNDKKSFYLILILTLTTLILGSLVNKIVFFIMGILCWGTIYIYGKKRCTHEFLILRMLILSIPLSFRDVFGRSYSVSILSWFNIFLLIMIIIYIFKYLIPNKAHFNYLSLLSIMLLFTPIIPILIANNIFEGLKQYINTMVLFILIILGNSFKYNLTDSQKYRLRYDYVSGTIIAGIGVLTQIFFIKILNITIGNYAFLGTYRHAYGFLFADYSFLSLYLVSGAMLEYFCKSRNTRFKTKNIVKISFLLIVSILTSARTGIVSFIIIFGIYSFLNTLNLIGKGSARSILLIIGSVILVVISYLLVGRTRSIAKFSDSGRNALNVTAFNIFLENPYFGIGFGNGNYPSMLPHNILFQSLAQGGLLYTIPLILFLVYILLKAYRKDTGMLPVLLCVLIGSFFIPNIFNSRFLPVLVLLLSISI